MIRCTNNATQVNLSSADLPSVLTAANSFSLVGWLVLDSALGGVDRGIARALNGFQVNFNTSSQLRTAMLGTNAPVCVTGATLIQPGDLALWCMNYDHSSRTVSAFFRSDSDSATLTGDATNGSYAGQGSAGAVGSIRIGTFTMSAALAAHAIVARNHLVSIEDFNLLWSRRRFDDVLRGGAAFSSYPAETFANTSPNRLVVGFVHTTQALNATSPAVPGGACTNGNIEWSNRDAASNAELLRIVRSLGTVSDCVFADPYALTLNGGPLTRNLPGSIAAPHFRARVSPLAYRLANGLAPSGVVRVLCPSNSRGSRLRDGENKATGYAGGLLEVRRSQVAGLGNMPPAYSGFTSGFPGIGTLVSSGTITNIVNSNLRRLWTGSLVSGNGPGIGALLTTNGASHLERASAIPDTLMASDAPMTVRRFLARYPGSADIEAFANTHSAETGTGAESSIGTLALDTTEASHAVVSATSTTVVIAGDVTANYTSGKCVAVTAGAGLNGVNFVAASSFGGGNTTVTLQFAWDSTPNNTSTVAVGPAEIVSVEHAFPGDGASPYKGIRIQRGAGLPVALFGRDFWRPGVNGWIPSPAGWGGNGYTPQINESANQTVAWWAERLATDLVLQFPAQQISATSSMADFTAQLRAEVPGVEIVHCGDIRFPGSSHPTWQSYILDSAETNQVAAVTPFESAIIGDREAAYCGFLLDDDPHPNQRGNVAIVTATLALLQDAALDLPEPIDDPPRPSAGAAYAMLLAEVLGEAPGDQWVQPFPDALRASVFLALPLSNAAPVSLRVASAPDDSIDLDPGVALDLGSIDASTIELRAGEGDRAMLVARTGSQTNRRA